MPTLSQGEKLALLWTAMVAILIFLALAMLLPTAHGQEVIMNVPSADVPNAGHVFVRSDSFYTQNPAFFMENFNVAVGLGHGLEASINGTGLAHYNYMISVVPGVKYQFYRGKNLTLYVGDQVTRPVRNTSYDVGNFLYTGAAYKIGSFRFTGGAWHSVNSVQLGQRAGAMGGIEWMSKPLYKGWMLGTRNRLRVRRGHQRLHQSRSHVHEGQFLPMPRLHDRQSEKSQWSAPVFCDGGVHLLMEVLSDFKFVVQVHEKVAETIEAVTSTPEACHFCGAAPITIVYRGWDDKIVTACGKHEEIVNEMIERDNQ